MSILDDRDITPDERAAIADEPRCGVWVEHHEVFSKVVGKPIISRLTGQPYPTAESIPEWRGDGRTLTQHETNLLIVTELHRNQDVEQADLVAIVGWPVKVLLGEQAFTQRGGIHSDPLVRLLAFRAWGERDRVWRKRDTARAMGEATDGRPGEIMRAWLKAYDFTGVTMTPMHNIADVEAWRGDLYATAERPISLIRTIASPTTADMHFDLLDELDAKLNAGGKSRGPLALGDGPSFAT